MGSMGLAERETTKQGTSQTLIFVLMYLYFKLFTAHPQDTNEGSPPALPEVITSLVTVKVTPEKVAHKLCCALCLCEFQEGEQTTQLPCSHGFHPQCITTWLQMHATCPVCRDELPH
ncbi:E3 ubiquitin-protein ligase RNF181-like [Orbicella faveolata]|uniref:E3 ubiquitin-protein ligase RNF181-like n=1 Tax=Orbicella faveolata TaxID=48498 RepID=UPI0009E25A0E|nr:E3 ubiquitin-protein ligase RNF181-like [Orbicella faveolata]